MWPFNAMNTRYACFRTFDLIQLKEDVLVWHNKPGNYLQLDIGLSVVSLRGLDGRDRF